MAKEKSVASVMCAKNLPSHGVYVVDGEGKNSFWTKVGCAWEHQDSEGFNLILSALPVSGRLVVRARKEEQ